MADADDDVYLDVDGNPLKKGAHYNLVDNNNKKINIFGYLGKNGTLKYQYYYISYLYNLLDLCVFSFFSTHLLIFPLVLTARLLC